MYYKISNRLHCRKRHAKRSIYRKNNPLYKRGAGTSGDVQIDHVVAVSDAWQKGAQQLDVSKSAEFYNDPLNLLAVDGPTNDNKGDSDAATWLASQ
jgi:hypothetical protein